MDNPLFAIVFVWVALWGVAFAAGDYRVGRELGALLTGATLLRHARVWASRWRRASAASRAFRVGDPVVYVACKYTTRPGPRAEHVHPCTHGETYSYIVRKLWKVVGVGDNGRIEVVTPRGKRRLLAADDPRLHRASPWEVLGFRVRWHKRLPPAVGV